VCAHELIHIFAPGKVANLQEKENDEDVRTTVEHSTEVIGIQNHGLPGCLCLLS
jgi:hypothetical protein